MFKHLSMLSWFLVLSLTGCASQETRFPQCSHYGFADCLQVDAANCDAMFIKAQQTCSQKLVENSMYESMPDTIKAGYLKRCLVDDVIAQSGLPADNTKACLHW